MLNIFKGTKTKKQQTVDVRRRRRNDDPLERKGLFVGRKQLITLIAFFAMTFVLVPICFVGESPVSTSLNPHQVARMRIVSNFTFSFPSTLRTRLARTQASNEMPAQYRRNDKVYEGFAEQIKLFLNAFETRLLPNIADLEGNEREAAIETFVSMLRAYNGLTIDASDLAVIIKEVPEGEQQGLFLQGLVGLRSILADGVYELPPQLSSASRARPTGYSHSLTLSEAFSRLKMYLDNLGVSPEAANALYRILIRGLQPNLDYDPAATETLKKRAMDAIPEQVVNVREGQVLVEPGSAVTPEQVETVNAYRIEQHRRGGFAWGVFDLPLIQRTFLTALLMVSAFIYLHLAFDRKGRSTRRMTLLGVVLAGSMVLLRLVSEVGNTSVFVHRPELLNLLPWAAPVAVGGMITAILVGGGPAVLMSVVISVLHAMMQGNSIEAFITSFLGGLTAIAIVRGVRQRGRVVRTGVYSGLALAGCAVLMGAVNELPLVTILLQVVTALVVGLFTGIFVIGVLPVIEYVFKYTSDITLLELTDFNQPLLRKLQMVAPGTYHHSLMVANLAERAASEINANALLCRATCLYHDIGKMNKPEYFVENQTDGFNPHDERNPTMSALVIKNHVKEGVQMAKEYKLPQVVMDVIREHHGTSLIKFFYNKALKQAQQAEMKLGQESDADSVQIDEAAFRYEGPRPQTRESAIILCADAVEAASRSLRKVSPQSIEELVDAIIRDRIEEGQLDEAPLTLEEIHKVRNSFCFSLINMLHSRIEYPKGEEKKKRPAPLEGAPLEEKPTA